MEKTLFVLNLFKIKEIVLIRWLRYKVDEGLDATIWWST